MANTTKVARETFVSYLVRLSALEKLLVKSEKKTKRDACQNEKTTNKLKRDILSLKDTLHFFKDGAIDGTSKYAVPDEPLRVKVLA